MALITHKLFTIDILYSQWNNRYVGKIKEIPGELGVLSGTTFEDVQRQFLEKIDEWVPDGRILH